MDKLQFKLWLENKESKQDKVSNLIDGQNLILFFIKDGKIFGAPEESRLVFANIKEPNEDMPDNWADDVNFTAFDLIKTLTGDRVENMFSKKDIKSISVIDKDKAEKILLSFNKKYSKNLMPPKKEKDLGLIKIKEKK